MPYVTPARCRLFLRVGHTPFSATDVIYIWHTKLTFIQTADITV